MNKKIIIILAVITLLCASITAAFFAKGYFESKKNSTHIQEAKELIRTNRYTDALTELSNVTNSKDVSTEVDSLTELCKASNTIYSLYENKNYSATFSAIDSLKSNTYYSLVSNNFDSLINTIISSILTQATTYLNNNDYTNGLSLIDDFLKLPLTKQETESLNSIKNQLVSKKNSFESKKRKELYKSKYTNILNTWDYTLNSKQNSLCDADFVIFTENRFKAWDGLVNEIWKELESYMPKSEFEALKASQLNWIKTKEDNKNLMLENKVGRHGNFVLIDLNKYLADETRERCIYLINNYM